MPAKKDPEVVFSKQQDALALLTEDQILKEQTHTHTLEGMWAPLSIRIVYKLPYTVGQLCSIWEDSSVPKGNNQTCYS